MMRYENINEFILESDLHPEEIFKKERALAEAFVDELPKSDGIDDCCVCSAPRSEILFAKWGCAYALCTDCWTVALAKVPDSEVLSKYHTDSELARFRASDEYQAIVCSTRTELWANQLEWIEGRTRRHLGMESYRVLDSGARIEGWIENLRGGSFARSVDTAQVLPPLESSSESTDHEIVCLMDALQRSAEPGNAIAEAVSTLSPGGLLVACCRSGSGFDVLTLLEKSKSVFPLDHICLPSPAGMRRLLSDAGLEIIEITTPGLLDVELVRKGSDGIPPHQYFQRYLLTLDEGVAERLQSFLQQNNLSSHLRAVARKPEA